MVKDVYLTCWRSRRTPISGSWTPGLREVFKDVDSITDYAGNLELSFIDYSMDEKPKYDVEECKARDATYAAPIKVRVRLRNKETEEIKEQEIFMGGFPHHDQGRHLRHQRRRARHRLPRSSAPPACTTPAPRTRRTTITYATTVIPYRGAWLEYETDLSDIFYVRIDKNRKLPITCLIRAVGPQDRRGDPGDVRRGRAHRGHPGEGRLQDL